MNLIPLEEAQQRLLAAVPAAATEIIPLKVAAGRILAEQVISALALPGFDNSAMDGYAVRAEDLKDVSETHPRELKLLGRVAAGEVFDGEMAPGGCVRIFTGSPLPPGANVVVMQEDTRVDAARPEVVEFREPVKLWENVRFKGEDVKLGDKVAITGSRITAGRLTLLSSLGVSTVRVGMQPVVGLVATGSELRESQDPVGPGQVYECNRAMLTELVRGCGGDPQRYPLVPDTLTETRAALEKAFAECDVVITSGGASVGEFDFVKQAFEAMGGTLDFWRVAIKPGKPFIFGKWRNRLLFGLPGNPGSALVTFLVLVRPALLRWQGAREVGVPVYSGILADELCNRADRRFFMQVRVDAEGQVHSAILQASHSLRALAEANGLVDVPAQTTLAAGTRVRVLRWERD